MKKITVWILVVLLLSLTGCAADAPEEKEVFSFTYNGIQISLNGEAGTVIAALGEPKQYTEEASCAFDGMDKTYYFGSFYLTTYPKEGEDYIYSIWFADDSVATEEGICIGASRETVENVYGAECFNGTNAFIMEKGETKLTVVLTDDAVSSVLYETLME